MDLLLLDYDIDGESAIHMIDTYKEIRQVRLDLLGKTGIMDYVKYLIGLSKRTILAKMPQELRWKIHKYIRR